MTRSTTRRTSVRHRRASFVAEPTHTALEAEEHVFTAYRAVSTPHRRPLWLEHTIRVDPTAGADDELVLSVSERYYDHEASAAGSGIDYEVSRPVRGYRKPLSRRELGRLVRAWYEDAHPSPDEETTGQERDRSDAPDRRTDAPDRRVVV
ncbi:hypothetical protein SAMN04487948_102225 [Halogranum amylolyticum]|uniref:Uncharacterized protein n=1 Tax=Halogranum amylolyticum TaxID=660520 RepID=A0A1H8PD43_9EURY|nr:hypothetical protein [Halogranum amylolyticum]SEO39614.1 hypothetical protein SAMN04487948_102225 [Halogranum amylolyticum]